MRTVGTLKTQIRKACYAVLRKTPKTRLVVRRTYWAFQRCRYSLMAKSIPVVRNRVFFESFGGRSYSCSPRAIYEEMIDDKRFSNIEFIWSFKNAECVGDFIPDKRSKIVFKGTDEYYLALASSGEIIINSRLPEYVVPKANQIVIQCWHGTPLKRLGYDAPSTMAGALNTAAELAERYRIDASKWTWLVSPSRYTTECLSSAFGLDDRERAEKVIEVGYPRNDALVRKSNDEAEKRAIQEKLGLPKNKKVLLYAPTWRDDSYKNGVGYSIDYLVDFEQLRESLSGEWVVLFRAHYFIENALDFDSLSGFVYNVGSSCDINDLYIASDALVTDYSSAMFDYANLSRPIVLYTPDMEHYQNDIRGFYFDIHEVPGPLCMTTEQLVGAIKSLGCYWMSYEARYKMFIKRFCPLDDGHAASRVLEGLSVVLDCDAVDGWR